MQSCCEGYLEFGAYEYCPKCGSKLEKELNINETAKNYGIKTFWAMWKEGSNFPSTVQGLLEVCCRIEDIEKRLNS